ncbi:hypothetical protein F5888DRAFT_1705359 [Russula emetica]|nr:hypothetical protein F5888DRAFT_1740561 [Russula emetica]KAF8496112.1 hypothetical protein F5888DRAFT_1705359 [Russula emetica]
MFIPTSNTPLSLSIPTLFICAAFATFTRELWYLLFRFLRKMDIKELVLDVFARRSDKTRTKSSPPRHRFQLRVLLASVSLRGLHIPPLLPFFGKLLLPSPHLVPLASLANVVRTFVIHLPARHLPKPWLSLALTDSCRLGIVAQ